MPLRPQINRRNPREIGDKIGRNLNGILGGIAATAPTEVEFEDNPPEDVTPPMSSMTSSSANYPRAKPLTGFGRFADTLGGGRMSRQIGQINATSGIAEANAANRAGLEGARYTHDSLLEAAKAGNEQALSILKQHLDTLQAVGLPYTKENVDRMLKLMGDPSVAESLAGQAITAKSQAGGITNRLNESSAARNTAEGTEAIERAKKLAAETPFIPAEKEAGIESTKAKTAGEQESTKSKKVLNDQGITPFDATGGFLFNNQIGLATKPQPGAPVESPPGSKEPFTMSPPIPGGLNYFPLGGASNSAPAPLIRVDPKTGRRIKYDPITKQPLGYAD